MKCPNCGKEVEYGVLYGMSYADRMFEDVDFEVRYENGDYKVKVQDDAADYFKQFNSDYFYGQMLDDLRSEDSKPELLCPECEEEFTIEKDGTTKKMEWTPIHTGKGMSPEQLIEQLKGSVMVSDLLPTDPRLVSDIFNKTLDQIYEEMEEKRKEEKKNAQGS